MNLHARQQWWQPEANRDGLPAALNESQWDLVVIGGGITGAGIFREAARLGWKVLLVEQQDFAWGTSSRSSKMVHGGLRYLGKGQVGLARDSVREREKLMRELPGLVDPLAFMMAHYRGGFPGPWVFGKLLALYDWLGGARHRRRIAGGDHALWAPGVRHDGLQAISGFGDAVTDDARLVMRVLQAGCRDGGVALNYLAAKQVLREGSDNSGQVNGLLLQDMLPQSTKGNLAGEAAEEAGKEEEQEQGAPFAVRARYVVNATGAWTDTLRAQLGAQRCIRPLRGSHLVVPFWRLPVGAAMSFFHPQDRRPVFVFPWEGTTVIGTTDLDHTDTLSREAAIQPDEVEYLLMAANAQFPNAGMTSSDVVATWAGVRPVVGEPTHQASAQAGCQSTNNDATNAHKPSDEKREHAIWRDHGLISVAGGKLTTYRLIAEEVLAGTELKPAPTRARLSMVSFAEAEDWTHRHLSKMQRRRLQGRYGLKVCQHLQATATLAELSRIGHTDTLWWELKWACLHEGVHHLDDLLLRRTRLGLLLPNGAAAHAEALKRYCQPWLGWSDTRWDAEWQRYVAIIEHYYSLPSSAADTGAQDSGRQEVAV